jgi:Ca2+-binding RTX toxin-like protein
MTVSYITKTELGHEDGVKNLDPDVKNALFNALYADGIYDPGKPDDGTKAWFQDDGNHFPGVSPITQILELDTNATVDTNPYLQAIIMDDAGGPHGDGNARQLTVNDGSTPGAGTFVAMGNAGDTVRLHDSGNDTVYGGNGNDLIDARNNTGNDSLVGGGGNDTIWGGSGHDTLIGGAGKDELHSGSLSGGYNVLYGEKGNDTLYGGGGADSLYGGAGHDSLVGGSGSVQLLQGDGGHDTLIAGTGSGQTLQGGGGHDHIFDNNSSPTHDTLIGGGGNDTITGQQGDYFQDTGPKGSHNQFWLYGNSGETSTLQGGAGDDTFHIDTKIGNDTILGGGGHDIVDFDKRSINALEPGPDGIKADAGGFLVSFKDGQQIQISGISELHFTDQNVKL